MESEKLYLELIASDFCISADLGSPKIGLFPKARGPYSILPWNHPVALPSARLSAVFWINSNSSRT